MSGIVSKQDFNCINSCCFKKRAGQANSLLSRFPPFSESARRLATVLQVWIKISIHNRFHTRNLSYEFMKTKSHLSLIFHGLIQYHQIQFSLIFNNEFIAIRNSIHHSEFTYLWLYIWIQNIYTWFRMYTYVYISTSIQSSWFYHFIWIHIILWIHTCMNSYMWIHIHMIISYMRN